jgi:hypothetical protein
MRFLTDSECAAWCAERGYPTRTYQGYAGLRADTEPVGFERIAFPSPPDSGKRVWLARFLLSLLEPAPELLFWLGDWAVWPSCQHMPLFARFREALGERRPLIETPGHLVAVDEADDGVSILAVALLFMWDCHVITASGRDVIFISHDEAGWFGSRDTSVAAFAAKRLEQSLGSGAA